MNKLAIQNKYFCFQIILNQDTKGKLSKHGEIIMILNQVLTK